MRPGLLDENEPAAVNQSGFGCGTRPGERIENDIARLRKGFDERRNGHHWFLISVKPVASVLPRQQVWGRAFRLRRSPLRQEKAYLVKALSIALSGAMPFGPGEMAHRSEAALLPDLHEAVDPRPTVKGGAKRIWLENPIEFRKCWYKPLVRIVSRASPAVTRQVTHQIRRIGANEINAFAWKQRQELRAVGMDNAAEEYRDRLQTVPFG